MRAHHLLPDVVDTTHPVRSWPSPPLVSLSRARADMQAGSGSAQCLVRLLDDVTVRVHAGELLLVRGHDRAGQLALLSVLAGSPHSPIARYVRGTRQCVPGVRICRGTIRTAAVPSIVAGCPSTPPRTSCASLYLLRASRDGMLAPGEADEWRRWSRTLLGNGGAIVVTAPHVPSQLTTSLSAIGEEAAHYAASVEHRTSNALSRIRTLIMQHGRLMESEASV